jgi:hypothetical protein
MSSRLERPPSPFRRLVRAAVVLALVGTVAGLAAAGGLVWRVRRGPLPLDFLIPRIEAALRQEDGSGITVEALELVWDGRVRQIELRARGLRAVRADGVADATLDAARIWLRRRALLRGEIALSALELDAPSLELVRDAQGHVALLLGSATSTMRDLAWLGRLMRRLERVAVRNGRVTCVDEPTRTTWVVPRVDGDVWRAGGPLHVGLDLTVRAGDATIEAWVEGTYRFESGTLALAVSTSGTDTRAALSAWPATVAAEARGWLIARVHGGRIGEGMLAVSGHLVRDPDWELAVDTIEASLRFDGLTVRYVDSMPPAAGVGGVARFARDGVEVAVAHGDLDGLALGPGTVRVAWPPRAPNHAGIDVHARGPLARLLAVLDHEPVSLGEQIRFPPDGVGGTAEVRVRLAFPLAGRLALGRLGLHAAATLSDVTVPDVVRDWDVARGRATVVLDDRALALDGTAELGGAPLTVELREHLRRPESRRLEIRGRLDAASRRALGLDPGAWLTGPVDTTVRIAPAPGGQLVADVDMDLAPAAIDLPSLAIAKHAGEPARAVARLALVRGVVRAVDRFTAVVGPLTLRGSAGGREGGVSWDRVEGVASFALPDRSGEVATAELALEGVETGAGWRATVTSADVGRLLRAYGPPIAQGGRMTFAGTVDPAASEFPFEGRLTIDEVTVERVPWLMKVVSLASIRGLLDLGTAQSVFIERAVATVAQRRANVLEVRDAVARGPTLAIRVSGEVDRTAGTLALEGTLVPSYYMLNEGADRIPIVGGVIGWATAGAVQAVTFTVRGPRTDPVVSVQPLSSLAPGVLRDWLRKLGL